MDNKLIDRIQKLLSLANSANENEAKLAASKANELMIKHNIQMSQLNQLTEEDYENREIFSSKSMPFEALWAMQICQSHFFVRCIYRSSRISHEYDDEKEEYVKIKKPAYVWFVGEQTNVQVAQFVFDFLRRKYKELWKEFQAEEDMPNSSKGSYYQGLTNGLHFQLQTKRKEVEKSMALVVVEDPKLDLMQKKFHPCVKDGNINHKEDAYAQYQGHQKGKELKIQRGLESSKENEGLFIEKKR